MTAIGDVSFASFRWDKTEPTNNLCCRSEDTTLSVHQGSLLSTVSMPLSSTQLQHKTPLPLHKCSMPQAADAVTTMQLEGLKEPPRRRTASPHPPARQKTHHPTTLAPQSPFWPGVLARTLLANSTPDRSKGSNLQCASST